MLILQYTVHSFILYSKNKYKTDARNIWTEYGFGQDNFIKVVSPKTKFRLEIIME